MDWAYWPNRDSAEIAAAIRRCALSVDGNRAKSYRLNCEVIFLAKQKFRYSLISISAQKSVPDGESDTQDQLSIPRN
jgi:hypothetical protein